MGYSSHPSIHVMAACLPRVSGVREPTQHFLILIGLRRQRQKRGCNGMVRLNIYGDYEAKPVLTSGVPGLFYCSILYINNHPCGLHGAQGH